MVQKSSWWYPFHYHILPPIFIVFFVIIVQYLAIIGQGQNFSWELALSNSLGDSTSWKLTSLFCLWAILWLKVPSRIVHGPETPFGTVPTYKANGVLYYWATLVMFFILQALYPNMSKTIYMHFPKIIGVFNVYGLVLCSWLLIKEQHTLLKKYLYSCATCILRPVCQSHYPITGMLGIITEMWEFFQGKLKPDYIEDSEVPRSLIFDFYKGVELHPKIFGMDTKQLTNCRIGMMGWEILICAFYLVGVEQHGFITSSFVHLLIQSVYIAKFFWWEVGYFHTLDMMMDRAGFYLCWGSLVVIPSLFTFTAAYTINHPPTIPAWISVLIGIIGLACILLTYRVDYEKQSFRESPNYECTIWGKSATYILAEYKDSRGNVKKSPLLTTGFWGKGRHLNYTFELGAAAAFCACLGFNFGAWNFLYFFFILILMFHRLYRDEEKCRNKYGRFWERYCKEVPYVLVPGIW